MPLASLSVNNDFIVNQQICAGEQNLLKMVQNAVQNDHISSMLCVMLAAALEPHFLANLAAWRFNLLWHSVAVVAVFMTVMSPI
jgi:hypothetical protein